MSDVSSVINFFSTANEGFSTTLASTISSGATTVPLNSVAGLTNGKIFVGIIEPGATAQQVFTGTVNIGSSQISNVVWTRGTNVGHASGVTVVDYVSGTAHNMTTAGILKQHTQAGAHTAITTDTISVSGNASFPGGTTLPAGDIATADLATNAVGISRLAAIESTDLFSGTALTAATWTDFKGNQNFTVDNANSVILISIVGTALVSSSSNASVTNSRIIIDSAGTPITLYVGGSVNLSATQPSNPFSGSGMLIVTGLTAGTHTIKTQIYAQQVNSSVSCRCSSQPNTEFFATYVMELKK